MVIVLFSSVFSSSYIVQPVASLTTRDVIAANANKAYTYEWHYLFGAEGEFTNDGKGDPVSDGGKRIPEEGEVYNLFSPVGPVLDFWTDAACGFWRLGMDDTWYHTDCSGLVYWAYTNWNGSPTGVLITRKTAADYWWDSDTLAESGSLKVGDLAFVDVYDASSKTWWVEHVGIYVGNDYIIHAHGGNDQKVVRWTKDDWKSYYRDTSKYRLYYGDLVSTLSGGSVGGIIMEINKFGLLAPYIGLASTAMIGAVATVVYVRRAKRKEEKQ